MVCKAYRVGLYVCLARSRESEKLIKRMAILWTSIDDSATCSEDQVRTFRNFRRPWINDYLQASFADLEIAKTNTICSSDDRDARLRTVDDGTKQASSKGRQPKSRQYICPIFVDETRRGLTRTCSGNSGDNLAELRAHLTRGSVEQQPHLIFLERCENCNEEIIDERSFHDNHGLRCEKPCEENITDEDSFRRLCKKLMHPACWNDVESGKLAS